jgi:hypothetical protein
MGGAVGMAPLLAPEMRALGKPESAVLSVCNAAFMLMARKIAMTANLKQERCAPSFLIRIVFFQLGQGGLR